MFNLYRREVASLRHTSEGTYVDEISPLSKWTRVGLIQTSAYVAKDAYDYDNIQVTEVTPSAVLCRPLRGVCAEASAVCVRRLELKQDSVHSRHNRGSVEFREEEAAFDVAAREARAALLARFGTSVCKSMWI